MFRKERKTEDNNETIPIQIEARNNNPKEKNKWKQKLTSQRTKIKKEKHWTEYQNEVAKGKLTNNNDKNDNDVKLMKINRRNPWKQIQYFRK